MLDQVDTKQVSGFSRPTVFGVCHVGPTVVEARRSIKMELAVKKLILLAAVAGVVAMTGCKKNTPPPAPAAQQETQPMIPPAYIPPSNSAPVTITPSDSFTLSPVTPVESAPVNQAPAKTRVAAPTGSVRPGGTYAVQKGDSLYSIASRAYGKKSITSSINAIKRANNLTSDNIRAGQKLKIPNRTSGNKD